MEFHDGRVVLHIGDCFDVLDTLPENSIDAVVTDPPYHLTSIVERFGAPNAKPTISATQRRFNKTGYCTSIGKDGNPTTDQYGRLSRGFMGKVWDGGDIAFNPELWSKVYRVLKPGGHMVAFGGTRTYHRMAVAIEDAGFEIRDMINWVYGSGFPKSHDISKAIDKMNGVEREIIGKTLRRVGSPETRCIGGFCGTTTFRESRNNPGNLLTVPATEEAKTWEGWGTALKPAQEPICLARKPLSEPTIAANVLKWGCGALNIDGCRIECIDETTLRTCNGMGELSSYNLAASKERRVNGGSPLGRWPANIATDGSDEVLALFPETKSGILAQHHVRKGKSQIGTFDIRDRTGEPIQTFGDEGSAARFFIVLKLDH